jgi:hypothetical protein
MDEVLSSGGMILTKQIQNIREKVSVSEILFITNLTGSVLSSKPSVGTPLM